jgi:transposase
VRKRTDFTELPCALWSYNAAMSAPDPIIAELYAENRRLRAAAAEAEQVAYDLRQERDAAVAQATVLERRIEQMRRRIYGASSERHHPGQQCLDLGLPVELPASTVDTAEAASATTTTPTSATPTADAVSATMPTPRGRRPQAGRHPGRRALPADAEVIVEEVTVPAHERLDVDGQPLPIIGYRTTDKWDYRVGTYLIRRFRRAVYGRPFSEARDRIVAPMPACLIPQGTMTDAALIHTVVAKFADHLPLYRQQQGALRTGIQLSRATLVTNTAAVATALRPIYDAIAAQVRAARYVHLDDTPVSLLDPGRGRTATARIWVYRSALATAFQFTTTRAGAHPAAFLGDYRGYIIADAYAGHERLYGADRATAIGCWAHVRRKFYDLRDHEPFARRMLDDIGRLYAIENDLGPVHDDEQRRRIRQARSLPILMHLRQRLDTARATVLPASDLGRAIAYALTRWPTLTPYSDYGFLPIDNNPAENALRPWAIGRKNWLFFGSPAGGERAAIIATLIENCRMQAIDPNAYLRDTIAALHRGDTDHAALTPQAYAQTHDARAATTHAAL